MSQLQKWQGKEKVNSTEPEIEDRPQFFALRLQKLAIDIYRTFLEDTRKSYDETAKIFRQHYNEKPVVFRGRLARRVQNYHKIKLKKDAVPFRRTYGSMSFEKRKATKKLLKTWNEKT